MAVDVRSPRDVEVTSTAVARSAAGEKAPAWVGAQTARRDDGRRPGSTGARLIAHVELGRGNLRRHGGERPARLGEATRADTAMVVPANRGARPIAYVDNVGGTAIGRPGKERRSGEAALAVPAFAGRRRAIDESGGVSFETGRIQQAMERARI